MRENRRRSGEKWARSEVITREKVRNSRILWSESGVKLWSETEDRKLRLSNHKLCPLLESSKLTLKQPSSKSYLFSCWCSLFGSLLSSEPVYVDCTMCCTGNGFLSVLFSVPYL